MVSRNYLETNFVFPKLYNYYVKFKINRTIYIEIRNKIKHRPEHIRYKKLAQYEMFTASTLSLNPYNCCKIAALIFPNVFQDCKFIFREIE
jgi:hypothetical protein